MSGADLKKVKAAAANRSKGKGKDTKMQYIICIGGATVSIVAVLIMLVINPDRGPGSTAVNDAGVITQVNRNAKTWQAAASSFFEGWTIGDVKMLEGVRISQMGGAVPACVVPEAEVPESFDAREKWPQCFSSPIYNMGNCTASWAIATASALSNRFCISNPTEHGELMLSPQHLLSCDTSNRGCSGGDIDTAFNFMEREGLVSEMCFPYQADGTVSCQAKCTTEQPLKAASHCVLNAEAMIQREIMQNGPVAAPLFLNDDFLVYRGGLYQENPTAMQISDAKRQRLIHAVKIVGWGKQSGKNYWLVENSWGEDWGEHGYAKIIRGGAVEKRESIIVESFVLAATPGNKDAAEDFDSDEDFEADVDLDDLDADLDADGESA